MKNKQNLSTIQHLPKKFLSSIVPAGTILLVIIKLLLPVVVFAQDKDTTLIILTEHQILINKSCDSMDLNTIRKEFLTELNIEREKAGIKPLKLNDTLNKAAQDYALYMQNNNWYNHYDKSGGSPEKRVKKAGYKKDYIAENIHDGPRNIFYFMQDQWESTPHKNNALNSNAEEVGIGYIDGYWVIDFGGTFVRNIIYTF